MGGLGTCVPGVTHGLICFQLCPELHRAIGQLEDALKDMRGG